MEKAQLGAFIAENRKAAGMTQKDLAERLHVTDKAVSKWERGLSYPDVTLLEPLAEVFHMGVTELAACDRNAGKEQRTEKEEQMAQAILRISDDSLRRSRGQSRRWIAALTAALLVVLAALVFVWQSGYVSETGLRVIVYKEAADDGRYIFLEQDGHLLRLKCGGGVDFDGIVPTNQYGGIETLWNLSYCWNRRTWQGTVTSCEKSERFGGVSPMAATGTSTDLAVVGNDSLFGNQNVMVQTVNCYPNPQGEGYISSYRFLKGGDAPDWYLHADELLLSVKDCLGYIEIPGQPIDGGFRQKDMDGDGENELLVRTPWQEKPCILYDMEDGKVIETWLDAVPPEMNAPYQTQTVAIEDMPA